MPFDRNPDGTIYQRPFGGHTANFGEKPVQARLCRRRPHRPRAAARCTSATCAPRPASSSNGWRWTCCANENGDVVGVTALEMETGEVYILEAKATVLATGGAGRIWAASTNAFINTGDGLGMAARAGIALQDMEFWQFHPTGVAGAGVLITEGVRGEGGILLNKDGERFMEALCADAEGGPREGRRGGKEGERGEGGGGGRRKGGGKKRRTLGALAPDLKDPGAARLRVALDGPGNPRKAAAAVRTADYVVLKLDHLGAETINKRLPSIREIAIKFGNVDPDQGTHPGRADHPLPDGRHPGQLPRPGRVAEGNGEKQARQRPVRHRRVRGGVGARRQPPGHQLAAGPDRVRPRHRQPHRRHGNTQWNTSALPADVAVLDRLCRWTVSTSWNRARRAKTQDVANAIRMSTCSATAACSAPCSC